MNSALPEHHYYCCNVDFVFSIMLRATLIPYYHVHFGCHMHDIREVKVYHCDRFAVFSIVQMHMYEGVHYG